MGSYNFTYKDVLKRYERIINKPSKFEIRLLATILLIITIVNITSLCFATEENSEPETIQPEIVSGLYFGSGANYMYSASNKVFCFPLEKGYIYTFTNNSDTFDTPICFSYDSAGVNVPIYDVMIISPRETYSFVSNDYNYLYFDSVDRGVLTRVKMENMSGAVSDLVDNVGISQIWDIFDTGIGFVGVVVVAAFGIFLVVIAIRKMQKGKSDF